MAWVCGVCSTNNELARTACVVCGAYRFPEAAADRFSPWEDHPVRLDRAALQRRGYDSIHRCFDGGRERYLLRSTRGYECTLSLAQLLCLEILRGKEGDVDYGQG